MTLNEYNILEWCGYYNTERYFDQMLHNPTVIDELTDNCIYTAEYWVLSVYSLPLSLNDDHLYMWYLYMCNWSSVLPHIFQAFFCKTSIIPTAAASVSQDVVQAASVQLELQDLLVKTGLKDRSRLLLGPFSCSTSLEARWCRHSGSPGPEPGPPKLLLDLKGGLLQVCIPMTWHSESTFYHPALLQFVEVRVRSAPLHPVRNEYHLRPPWGLKQGLKNYP